MRTTLSIDDYIISQVMQYTRQKSAVQAIRTALDGYLEHMKKQRVLALRGTLAMTDDWKRSRQLDTTPL